MCTSIAPRVSIIARADWGNSTSNYGKVTKHLIIPDKIYIRLPATCTTPSDHRRLHPSSVLFPAERCLCNLQQRDACNSRVRLLHDNRAAPEVGQTFKHRPWMRAAGTPRPLPCAWNWTERKNRRVCNDTSREETNREDPRSFRFGRRPLLPHVFVTNMLLSCFVI